MSSVNLTKHTTSQKADTASSANSIPLRDSAGDLTTKVFRAEDGVVSAGYLQLASLAKTSSFTASDKVTFYLCNATSGAIVATLPPAADVTGRVLVFKKTDASGNAVTVTGDGAETIDGSNTKALSSQYKAVAVYSNGVSFDIFPVA